MVATGEFLIATASAWARVDAVGSTTSTSYTGTMASGSAPPGVAFTAPPSGKVTIHYATAGFGSAASEQKTAVRIGTGSTVGSGTEFYAADDKDMIVFNNTGTGTTSNTYGIGRVTEISGLTVGAVYNVQMRHKVTAGTGSWLYRVVKVVPDP